MRPVPVLFSAVESRRLRLLAYLPACSDTQPGTFRSLKLCGALLMQSNDTVAGRQIAWWMLDLFFGLDASGFDKSSAYLLSPRPCSCLLSEECS